MALVEVDSATLAAFACGLAARRRERTERDHGSVERRVGAVLPASQWKRR
jgi:hypothetical protein